MNMNHILLAKSQREENGHIVDLAVSLLDHSKAVLAAARAILDEVEDFLPAEVDKPELRKLVLAGAVLHDLGKANSIFQQKIRRELREFNQPLRHEILSALIVAGVAPNCARFSKWLESAFQHQENPARWAWMLSWVVGGHHLKMHHVPDYESGQMAKIIGIPPDNIVFPDNQAQPVIDLLVSVLREMGASVSTPHIPSFEISTDLDGDNCHAMILDNYVYESEDVAEELSPDERLLTAVAKGLVIAADIAGSALWDGKNGDEASPEKAIRDSLEHGLSNTMLDDIINQKTDKNGLWEFQKQVGRSAAKRTILEAACGGGKTVAAYEWSRRHAGRKLIFCYPTTGTASAGFKDYLHAQTELERALIHSRADADIKYMSDNGKGGGDEEWDTVSRIESLRAWGQQAIACTVDAVLGLMQNQRRGLFSFPAILRSAIVFDEIHSYDSKLFGTLLRFLNTFPNIPVLLMTASLSPARRNKLIELSDVKHLNGDSDEERKDRYRIERQDDPANCWNLVIDSLNQKDRSGGSHGKVLWVCNTVKDATKIYEDSLNRKDIIVEPMLYHSRYRYRDRVEIQDRVISAFKSDGPCLAVTTQVCEMSLDISASLLVTARPPFPALVQRLGRLNRKREFGDNALCLEYPFEGRDRRPYRLDDLKTADEIIGKLAEKTKFSQADLREHLKDVGNDGNFKQHSAWLDDSWESGQATLREGDSSITVLMKADEAEIRKASLHKNPTARDVAPWTIPMLLKPRGSICTDGTIGGFPLVTDQSIEYDEKGARWREPKA